MKDLAYIIFCLVKVVATFNCTENNPMSLKSVTAKIGTLLDLVLITIYVLACPSVNKIYYVLQCS